MAENTKIEWASHTFSPWRGCTKVSPGCAHCYAETLSGRNPGTLGVWGPGGTRVVAAEAQWRLPVPWNAAAEWWCERCESTCFNRGGACSGCGKGGPRRPVGAERPRVFCASLADVFEDWPGRVTAANGNPLWWCHGSLSNSPIPSTGLTDGCRYATLDDVRERLFDLIGQTPHLDWLLLTKRPQNVLRMTHDAWCRPVPGHVSQNEGDGRHWHWPPNVWLGVSVEDQQRADERIPLLLGTPAAVRFLSCEPLLGPVDLTRVRHALAGESFETINALHKTDTLNKGRCLQGVGWVIVGGESGPGARPLHMGWARSLVKQCKAAGVACFVKQLGSNPVSLLGLPVVRPDGDRLRDRKGGDIDEFPEDLRVRAFPEVRNG